MEPIKKLKIKNLKNKNKKTKNDKKMNDTYRSLRQELIFLFNSIHCFVPIIQIFISKKFIVYEIPLPPAVMKWLIVSMSGKIQPFRMPEFIPFKIFQLTENATILDFVIPFVSQKLPIKLSQASPPSP